MSFREAKAARSLIAANVVSVASVVSGVVAEAIEAACGRKRNNLKSRHSAPARPVSRRRFPYSSTSGLIPVGVEILSPMAGQSWKC